jgi:hypothetical protein
MQHTVETLLSMAGSYADAECSDYLTGEGSSLWYRENLLKALTEALKNKQDLYTSQERVQISQESVHIAQPVRDDEFATRGELAARLKCWHRLTGEESDELVDLLRAQPVREPIQFLCDATRFKVRQAEGDEAGRIYGLPSELNGKWVALVAADDDCHLNLSQPVQVPLTDDDIADIWDSWLINITDKISAIQFAREIEAAHHIGITK